LISAPQSIVLINAQSLGMRIIMRVWIIPALCLADKRPTLHRRSGCSEEIEGVGAGMAVTPCVMVSKFISFLWLGVEHWMETSLSLTFDVWMEISWGI
jgi:hypothetical protein